MNKAQMNQSFLRRLIAVCILLLVTAGETVGAPQQRLTSNVTSDPTKAEFVYQDIEHFVSAYESIANGADRAETLQDQYFGHASPGLLMFIEKYDLTVERLLKSMDDHPDDYARLAESLPVLREQEPSFRKVYAELKRAISGAVFPPTYFLVGAYRGIGSGSIEGPLITIEKKTAESLRDGLDATLIHEMTHMQQLQAVGEEYFTIFSGNGRSLLALAIREGAATYFTSVITGGSESKNRARDFYLANEQRLWASFRTTMLGAETGDWMWRKPTDPNQPRDVGYAIGARIVEAYIDRAPDKGEAARNVMEIVDYPAFLDRSGYAELMKQAVKTK